ncbi:MAG: thioredoxin family protein [Thiotrichales bacterium]|nr:thioredoxin family protein [Thiotrichales bacterium]
MIGQLAKLGTAFGLTGALLFYGIVHSTPSASLPELENLPALSAQAKQKELPILLLFSAQWCEYCTVLKEQVLEPMMLGGLYEGRYVYLRQVSLEEDHPIVDWHGKTLTKRQWAYQLGADLTPTLLFVDGNGKEVAERITGIPELTLFAGLIHNRLNQAYQNMELNKRIPSTPEQLAAMPASP